MLTCIRLVFVDVANSQRISREAHQRCILRVQMMGYEKQRLINLLRPIEQRHELGNVGLK